MARRAEQSTMGGGGMMAPVMSIATGLLIFVILIIFAPTIAGSIQNAQPAMPANSGWNSTFNPDLPDGVTTWTTNIQILGIVVLIISIAVAMFRGKYPDSWIQKPRKHMLFPRVETTSRAWLERQNLSSIRPQNPMLGST